MTPNTAARAKKGLAVLALAGAAAALGTVPAAADHHSGLANIPAPVVTAASGDAVSTPMGADDNHANGMEL
ncbi:hypothetical protein [Streptomyces caatingaensis]|uniref:Chaplin domain-containing protein n=1 Tax=Streptomyces caatingaensis TaxID=1678637 RepID=A0A0K9XAT8_9ACTN|nr:hypothetical protein [Streptomyces caatingaensis]KNB50196.1 hypothetical protein AC230_26285 [Streptomyces caatingaensis]